MLAAHQGDRTVTARDLLAALLAFLVVESACYAVEGLGKPRDLPPPYHGQYALAKTMPFRVPPMTVINTQRKPRK